MADTLQSRAINAANTMLSIAQQLAALRATVNQFVTQYNNENFSSVWNSLGTCVQNADGSLGAVDGTPNTAHPINVGIYPTLNRAVTATQLVNGVAMIEQLQNFFSNAVVVQNNYGTTVDQLSA